MPRKVRQIKADLRALGFYNRDGRDDYTNRIHPALPEILITVAGQDEQDCQPYNEGDLRKTRWALAALK